MPTYVRSGGTWLDVSGGGSPSIPSGVSILFYEASAPLGWTKVTTQNNKALRVVSGTGGVTGGSTPFTSVFTSRNVSGSVSGGSVSVSVSGNTGGRSLSESQLASHGHGFSPNNGGFRSLFMSVTATGGDAISGLTPFPQNAFSDGGSSSVSRGQINNAGSNFQHDHFFSGSGSGSLSGASFGTTLDFAVQYIDIIIARKD